MTNANSIDWNPERDLTALLDALTEELLAMPDRDIAAAKTGMAETTQDVRRLIAAAESDLVVPPGSDFLSRGLRAFVARNQ